jgi:hypothetical protein
MAIKNLTKRMHINFAKRADKLAVAYLLLRKATHALLGRHCRPHASLHSHALAHHILTLQEAKVNRINAPLDWQNQRTMPMPPCMPIPPIMAFWP